MATTIDSTSTSPLDGGAEHVAISSNPFTLNNAKKAYAASISTVLAVAGGLAVTQFFHDGAIDTNALLAEGLSLAGLFVVTFIGAWLPTNAKK